MLWPFNIYNVVHPKEKYIWAQARILHETGKAKKISLRSRSRRVLLDNA